MTVSMNGVISVSKLMLRHWRDVCNRKRPGYQNVRSSPCLSSTNNTLGQNRCASAAKALVYHGQHRLPQSDIPATTAERRPRLALQLRTLDQTRLDVEDFVHLNGRIRKDVRFPLAPEQPRLQMRYFDLGPKKIPFPPDAQGFLYWHLDPDAPLLSGQVRFRITTHSDPATFASGRDLQRPDGGTWNISLFDIARRSRYSGLRAHFICENLVTAKVLYTALNITGREGARRIHPATGSLLIWSFGQRFLVDLQSGDMEPWIIGSLAGERLRLQNLFSVRASEWGSTGIVKSVYHRPYTGVLLQLFVLLDTYTPPIIFRESSDSVRTLDATGAQGHPNRRPPYRQAH
ncbi:hypothetical protein OE88DRAFT_1668051 [Heliocybe sulcata]|uniref:Uncharacterized protein n=1 Tax=Heliocybe sulcata TaxID=5364 RepID=A0A5C3MXJ4_9AGAM|nr:hypothetical protein OE88DRAFT_1668051 [Heliocybe sulcata]